MLTATDTNLELLPWTPVIDLAVNPVLAEGYRAVNLPDSLASYCVGPKFAGGLVKLERPIVPGCFKPSMTIQVLPDQSTLNAQAFEFDLRIQLGGINYNFSAQIDYSHSGGMLQVSTAAGGWIDTGFIVGKLQPDVWTTLQFAYSFDTGKKTFSVLSVTIGGKVYAIPANLQNVAAAPLNWQDGIAVIQIQMDLGPNGGACSHKVKVALGWN